MSLVENQKKQRTKRITAKTSDYAVITTGAVQYFQFLKKDYPKE